MLNLADLASVKAFYEKFTGIKVLPARYFNVYKTLVEAYDYITAENLLVNIHQGMYRRLKFQEQGAQIETKIIDIVKKSAKIERHFVIVALCKYDPFVGMTDDVEEIKDNPFL